MRHLPTSVLNHQSHKHDITVQQIPTAPQLTCLLPNTCTDNPASPLPTRQPQQPAYNREPCIRGLTVLHCINTNMPFTKAWYS